MNEECPQISLELLDTTLQVLYDADMEVQKVTCFPLLMLSRAPTCVLAASSLSLQQLMHYFVGYSNVNFTA
jgi:hypothetical protein